MATCLIISIMTGPLAAAKRLVKSSCQNPRSSGHCLLVSSPGQHLRTRVRWPTSPAYSVRAKRVCKVHSFALLQSCIDFRLDDHKAWHTVQEGKQTRIFVDGGGSLTAKQQPYTDFTNLRLPVLSQATSEIPATHLLQDGDHVCTKISKEVMHHGIIYSWHKSSIKVVHLRESGGIQEVELFGKFAMDQVYLVDSWGLVGSSGSRPAVSPQEIVQRVQDALQADVPVHCSPAFNSEHWVRKMKAATNARYDMTLPSSQQSGEARQVDKPVDDDLIPARRAASRSSMVTEVDPLHLFTEQICASRSDTPLTAVKDWWISQYSAGAKVEPVPPLPHQWIYVAKTTVVCSLDEVKRLAAHLNRGANFARKSSQDHHFLTTGVMRTYGYSCHPGLTLVIDPNDLFVCGGLTLDQYEWRPAVATDQEAQELMQKHWSRGQFCNTAFYECNVHSPKHSSRSQRGDVICSFM